MPKNIGEVQVKVGAETKEAEKKITGLINDIDKKQAKFDIELDISEISKSISQVERELKNLTDVFTGNSKAENKIKEIAGNLDELRNSILKVVHETSTEAGKKESFLKVDFVDDFKSEMNSLMPLIKEFYSAFNKEQIIALSSAFDKMSSSIEQMSNSLSLIVGKQGLADLLPVDEAKKNMDTLQSQVTILEKYQNDVNEILGQENKIKKVFTNMYDYMDGRWTKDSDPFRSASFEKFLEDASKLNSMGVDFSKITVQFQEGAKTVEKSYADLFNKIQEFGTGQLKRDWKKAFPSILEGMTGNFGKGTIEDQLQSARNALNDAIQGWQKSKEVLETPMRVHIEDESLKGLNKLITETKNNAAGLSTAIKIEGFDSAVLKEMVTQLDKIVVAIRDVNLALQNGVNFSYVSGDLETAKIRMQQFNDQLNQLGISKEARKNIFGFDAIVKELELGKKSVQEASLAVQEAYKNGMTNRDFSAIMEQQYLQSIDRIKKNLLIQFPQIDFSNYTEFFDKIKSGSMDAVEALNAISNAERKTSVNVPVTSFGQEDVDRLKSLVGSLKGYLKGINDQVKTFNTDFNNSFEFTKATENLRLFLEETRQVTTTLTTEFKGLGDSIVGSITSIPDNTKRTISELRDQITEVGTLIRGLLDEDFQGASDGSKSSKYSKSLLKITGLEKINTNKLNNELSSMTSKIGALSDTLNKLEETLKNLHKQLERPVNINIDLNTAQKAKKSVKEVADEVTYVAEESQKAGSPIGEFINKLKELKKLYTEKADSNFFKGLINDLMTGKTSVEKAIAEIENRYNNLLSGKVGINSLNNQQKVINLRQLQNSKRVLDSIGGYDPKKAIEDSDYSKKYKNMNTDIQDFQNKVQQVILTLNDGTKKAVSDLSELGNVDLNKVVNVEYIEKSVAKIRELSEVAQKAKAEMQEANSSPINADNINTTGLEKDQAEIKQTKTDIQELRQEANTPITPSVNTTEFNNVRSFIETLQGKINELQGEGKEGVPVNIKPIISLEKITSAIPENVSMEIIPFIEQSMLDQIRLQLESVFKASKDIKIEIPDNFANVLNKLQTKLSATNTEGGRNLVEQIESITAALAMLDQIDLRNLNLSKAFNVGNGQNFEKLANQLKTVSEAVTNLSKEGNKIPDNIFGGLAKVDDISALNSINFVTLAEGLKRLKTAFKDFPESIPDLSNIGKFIKTVGQIKFNAEAIASFNSLNIKQLKEICNIGVTNSTYDSLGQSLSSLKEGIVAINRLRKLPDFSTIKVTKTNVDNLKELSGAIEILGKKLAEFSEDAQKALKSLSELAANLAGIKNIDKLLSLTPEKINDIQNKTSGKSSVAELNKQATETYKELTDATTRYYEAKEMLNMNPSVDAINKEKAAMEELIVSYSKLEQLERQGSTNASGYLSKYNDSVDAYTSLPFKELLNQQAKALKEYKDSLSKVSGSNATDYDRTKLVESSNKLKSIQEQINQLDIEDNALIKERNNLLSQQSEVEKKYYASLSEKQKGYQKKYDELLGKTGDTPLMGDLASKLTNMKNITSQISSGSLFGNDLLNAQQQFLNLENSIKDLFTTITKNPDLKEYMNQYKEAIKSYKSSMEALSKGKETPTTNATLVEAYNKIVTLEKQINDLKNKGVQLTEQEKTALNQAAEIRAKYADTLNGRLSNHEDALKILDNNQEGKLTAYAERVESIRKKFEELRIITSNVTSGKLVGNDLIQAQQGINKLENELKELEKTVLKNGKVISSWSSGLGEIGKAANGNDAIDGMKSYVETLKNAQVENTYVTDKAATLTYTIKNQSGEIQKVTLAWDNMTNSIKMVSVQGTTGLTRLGSMISTIGKKIRDISAYWMGMYLNPFEFLQRGREAINQVVELDTAMVELQKTTSATQSQLNQFYSHSNDIAKEYGNTTADIISATADWSRMGYSLADSEELAKFSSQFASISENLTVEDAGNTLISVLKGFGKETSDVLDVMNKINIVGNNFAVTNADIAEGLRQSSAAMHFAGNSLDETISLFTAGNEVLRDASSMGSALKSVSMRIRGYDEETNRISSELENITGDIADLTHGKVRIKKDANTYNSTIEVLRQVAEMIKNNELTDAETAKLTEKLFAKTRANFVARMYKNEICIIEHI